MLGSRMMGPLALYASGYYDELIAQGYSQSYAERQMYLMSQVNRWAAEAGLRPHELTTEVIDRFLALRRSKGYKLWISTAAMAPLMRYLRGFGAVPEPSSDAPPGTELGRLLEEYRTYLIKERGLAPDTISSYLSVARLFLSKRLKVGGLDLKDLTAAEVTAFVTQEARGRRTGSAKSIVKGVRALLRFLHVDGKISTPSPRRCQG